ncbi:MAG TPA: topoisomerase DNA-binding C4 zinc finger domain-containing protein [Nitrosopumilaceae archaeon]|jgi:ssDNA-binding Zn-finger/Zn-ribbon topoisomerase 1|nr:topoisomerase DNA-binding C4 zinc finger domain-containing protein [Nitrosopumilaceae archaeon]
MKPENVKCPECEGPMISRKSEYGVFWGCKSYPLCKGTRDSMGRSKQEREEERIDNQDE